MSEHLRFSSNTGKLFVSFFMLSVWLVEPCYSRSMYKEAIFAGGCFWCMEASFEKLEGVAEVISGYLGGYKNNPNYDEVSEGWTGHYEAVKVVYDPEKTSYSDLLKVFWRQIDPTDPDGQFIDRGSQYRTAVFYLNDEQNRLAEKSKKELEESGKFDRPIVTEIIKAKYYYPAEKFHQDYYKKHPLHYKAYRSNSGRDQYLENVWNVKVPENHPRKFKKLSDSILKNTLTPLQYAVTQKDSTESPFNNEYWNNKRAGIYVDVVSGEPLFSSADKFDSETGWPSFIKPLEPENILEKEDRKMLTVRTEVRSKKADSHLGHLFDDGSPPTNKRYCINSASLRFIPKKDLERKGYGKYKKLFSPE